MRLSMVRQGQCLVSGCQDTTIVARGWCRDHYYRWRWHGDPLAGRHNGNPEERFLLKLDKQEDGCWLWTAGKNEDGYGSFWGGEKEVLAHRWSYEHFVGRIADGLSVLHRCDVRSCVNPAHLFVGSQLDNMRDAAAKGRSRATSLLVAVEIQDRYARQPEAFAVLARLYGLNRSTITRIVRRKGRFSDLPPG